MVYVSKKEKIVDNIRSFIERWKNKYGADVCQLNRVEYDKLRANICIEFGVSPQTAETYLQQFVIIGSVIIDG